MNKTNLTIRITDEGRLYHGRDIKAEWGQDTQGREGGVIPAVEKAQELPRCTEVPGKHLTRPKQHKERVQLKKEETKNQPYRTWSGIQVY